MTNFHYFGGRPIVMSGSFDNQGITYGQPSIVLGYARPRFPAAEIHPSDRINSPGFCVNVPFRQSQFVRIWTALSDWTCALFWILDHLKIGTNVELAKISLGIGRAE